MNDLRQRLRDIEGYAPPDLWKSIVARTPRSISPEPSPIRRLLVAIVAFTVAVAGFVYVVRAFDGSDRRAPATSPAAALSANGLIYFQFGGKAGTWTDAIQPNGSGRVTVIGRETYAVQITWSPDGTRIAYVGSVWADQSPDGETHFGIFTANPDGSDAQQLTEGANDGWPTWSPDGSRIAFSSTRADPTVKDCIAGGDYFCPTDIYVMNSNGTDVTRLTEDPVPEYAVAWSPDGGRIALVRTEGDTNEIDVMNADGTNRIPIVSGTGGNQRPFTWSPDGTQIAFVAVGPESWDIRVIGADGSDNQKIFGQDGVWSEGPVWSPDGTQIAFSSTAGAYPPGCGNSSDVCSDLFVMRSDGSDLVRLTQEANGVHGISWQPIPIDTTPPASPLPGASTEPQYPVPIEGVMALPAQTYIEAGTSVMPLTFPDGAKLELVFPVGIDLSGLGIRASTLGDIGTLDGSGCCARPIELFYGEPSDIPFLGDPVVDVFSGVGGADVLLQKGDPQDGAELYLVYRFGPWTALVYDTWDGMTDAQRQTWAASLEGSVSSEGFLVLQASAPLLLEEARYPMGPKLQIVGPSDRPALSVLPTRCDPELPGQVEVEVFGQAQDAFASWCPAGGVVKMLATGDSELIEALVAGLSAREP